MKFNAAMNCPHCDRLLYSRTRETCAYCGGVLPAEFRLSEEEMGKIAEEKRAMEARRKRDKAKEEEEREKQRKKSNDAGGYMAF